MFKELILVVFVDVSQYKFIILWNIAVAPFAGAWIEIMVLQQKKPCVVVAPFAGAWIEISTTALEGQFLIVAPFAGAWIEIVQSIRIQITLSCRSLRGSVD